MRKIPYSAGPVTRARLRGLLLGTLLAASSLIGDTALAVTERSQEYFEDAIERLQGGDVNAAIIQLRNAIQEDPENAEARATLGRLYLERGDLVAAEKELSRAYATIKTDQLQLQLGQALLGLGRGAEALEVVQPTAEDDEIAWQKQLVRIEAMIMQQQVDAAETALTQAIEQQPLDPIVNLLYARLEILRNRFDAARDRLDIALDVSPDSYLAWLLKAQVTLGQGALNDAKAAAEEALELVPEGPMPKLVLAEIDLRRGRLDEALTAVDALLEDNADNLSARFLRVNILAAQEKFDEADRAMRQIAEPLRAVPRALLVSGIIKARTDQLAQAQDLIARYVTEVPGDRSARRLLANIQMTSGRDRTAVETLAPLVGPQSQDLVSLQMMSTAQLRADDYQGARDSFRRISRLAGQNEAQQARSFLALLGEDGSVPDEATQTLLLVLDDMRNARLDDAGERAQALAEASPEDANAQNILGAIELARGNDEQARQHFEKALQLEPGLQGATDNLNRLDVRAGKIEAVEARLREQLANAPDNEALILQLAGLLSRDGRLDEAVELLEGKRAELAGAVQVRLALAGYYVRQERTAELAAVTQELMQIGTVGGNPQGFEAAANLYAQAGDMPSAVKAFEDLARALPDSIPAKLALARAHYLAQDTAAARATLDEVRGLDPANVVANNSIVDLYLLDDNGDAAVLFAESLEGIDAPQAASLKAKALLSQQRTGDAIAVLQEAHETAPSPVTARNLFLAKRQAGMTGEAADELRAWVTANPDDAGNLEILSQALIVNEDYAAAAAPLEQALQLTPNNPTILNNLAWLRYELGRPGAIDLARRAHQLAPQSPEITDTLGWILVKEGEVDEGLPLLREAHAGLEDNPDIRYHLAYALNASGDTAAALETLAPLGEVEQPFMEKKAADQLLQKLR